MATQIVRIPPIIGIRRTCPETVLEYLRDAVPKAKEEAIERLRCGDILGAVDALYTIWSAFDHLCAIADFYTSNICEHEGEPFLDIPPYQPTPREQWQCNTTLAECLNQPLPEEQQLAELIEELGYTEALEETRRLIRERHPQIPTQLDLLIRRIERHERIFNEAMRLMDEAKIQHYECTQTGTEECWERYRALLRAVKILSYTERYRVGKLDQPFKRRERPPPTPPPGIFGTLNTMILTLSACAKAYEIKPQIDEDKATQITRTATQLLEAEAKRKIDPAFVTAKLQIMKIYCTKPYQFSGGACTQYTIQRVNTRARTLERRLKQGRITQERYEQLIKELEEKCIELRGTWDGTRCR